MNLSTAAKKTSARTLASPPARSARTTRHVTAYSGMESGMDDPIETSGSEEREEQDFKVKKRGGVGGGNARTVNNRVTMEDDNDVSELEESLGLEDEQVQAQ